MWVKGNCVDDFPWSPALSITQLCQLWRSHICMQFNFCALLIQYYALSNNCSYSLYNLLPINWKYFGNSSSFRQKYDYWNKSNRQHEIILYGSTFRTNLKRNSPRDQSRLIWFVNLQLKLQSFCCWMKDRYSDLKK